MGDDSAPSRGTMLAARPGETSYVRYSREGDMITARYEEYGAYLPIFRVASDGTLWPVDPAPLPGP